MHELSTSSITTVKTSIFDEMEMRRRRFLGLISAAPAVAALPAVVASAPAKEVAVAGGLRFVGTQKPKAPQVGDFWVDVDTGMTWYCTSEHGSWFCCQQIC